MTSPLVAVEGTNIPLVAVESTNIPMVAVEGTNILLLAYDACCSSSSAFVDILMYWTGEVFGEMRY